MSSPSSSLSSSSWVIGGRADADGDLGGGGGGGGMPAAAAAEAAAAGLLLDCKQITIIRKYLVHNCLFFIIAHLQCLYTLVDNVENKPVHYNGTEPTSRGL